MPSFYSRDRFCIGLTSEDGDVYLSEPEPVRFVDRADNIEHRVTDGETWGSIAFTEYGRTDLDHVIADFQPEPIDDMTIPPTPGSVLVLPSQRFVEEEILTEDRREAHQA